MQSPRLLTPELYCIWIETLELAVVTCDWLSPVQVCHWHDICDPDGLHVPKLTPSIVISAYSEVVSKSVIISSTLIPYILFGMAETYPFIRGPLDGELVAKTLPVGSVVKSYNK